jgi:hypothetical protein
VTVSIYAQVMRRADRDKPRAEIRGQSNDGQRRRRGVREELLDLQGVC